MLTKRNIPCLDVSEGRVVRGINLLKLGDAGDPVINAKAHENQTAEVFGSHCACIATDVKKSRDDFEVFTYVRRRPTGVDAVKWAKKAEELGAREIFLTNMDRDGIKIEFHDGTYRDYCWDSSHTCNRIINFSLQGIYCYGS